MRFCLEDEMLTPKDYSVILEALKYSKMKVENTGIEPHGVYPSYAFKMERLGEIDTAIKHLRDMKEGKA
jgi:hypothetical protein